MPNLNRQLSLPNTSTKIKFSADIVSSIFDVIIFVLVIVLIYNRRHNFFSNHELYYTISQTIEQLLLIVLYLKISTQIIKHGIYLKTETFQKFKTSNPNTWYRISTIILLLPKIVFDAFLAYFSLIYYIGYFANLGSLYDVYWISYITWIPDFYAFLIISLTYLIMIIPNYFLLVKKHEKYGIRKQSAKKKSIFQVIMFLLKHIFSFILILFALSYFLGKTVPLEVNGDFIIFLDPFGKMYGLEFFPLISLNKIWIAVAICAFVCFCAKILLLIAEYSINPKNFDTLIPEDLREKLND